MALSKVNPNFVNQLGRRNLIINGDFMVAQRGTSQTSSGYGSVDRWYLYSSGGTYSQSTSSPPDGFSHYLTCTGATGSVIFAQGIELPATGKAGVFYNGQTITVSYYAKSTVAGDALYNPLSFRNSQTSITNLVNIDNDSSDNNILTTSWAKYSKTYTIGVSAHANNICLVVQPRTSGAPSGDISITGVQLEVGDTATEFEHRSFGEELAACQRYFYNPQYNLGGSRTDYACNYSVSSGNNGWITWIVPFPVTMRANSTFSHSLTNAKTVGSAAPGNGVDGWSFYVQNQGYTGISGNGDMSTLSGDGKYQGVVGTYYVSPSSTSCSHILVGNGCTFQFNAEL
jgi:hypothetical protein